MRATITMPLETVKSIIERAREYELVDDEDFDDEEGEDEDDDDSDVDSDVDSDDDDTDEPLLVANDDDLDEEEGDDLEDDEEAFEDVLEGLTSEELAELLALSWVGEGDYENWDEAVGAARALSQDDLIVQLAENPTLSDAIERGLVALGYQISDD
jgi:hypothetical protein